jgi:hypothetical protein
MARKLKVYRTPIGFHDAYVAATSQKEALKAWGSDVDLFARGVAEAVRDEALMRAPLDAPGTVVKRPRGTSEAFMASLPDEPATRKRRAHPSGAGDGPPPRHRSKAAPPRRERKTASTRTAAAPQSKEKSAPSPAPKPKPARPRPSRTKLEAAEASLDRARSEHDEAIADLRARERELQQRRRALETDHDATVERLENAIARERERYGVALQKWRG